MMVNINVSLASRLIGTALSLSFLTSACSNNAATTAGGPPATPVQVQQMESNTVQDSTEFVGNLEARQRVALRPKVEGRIVRILVDPGDTVRVGTPIVELEAKQNQAQVGGALADVEAAGAARNTAAAQLKSAQADRERAASDVELQTTDYQRVQSLVAEGAQSQQSLDQAKNRRDTAIAALKAADQSVGAARASLNEAEARLTRARADQTVARENLQDNRVTAPIAGIVGNIPVKVGDYVSTTDTLTSIIQNQALDLNISLPIERSNQLVTGLPVELVDEQNKVIVTGRVSFVSPQVDNTAQLILAKATFPNTGRLKDGQYVRARVIWKSGSGVLVPTSAVTRIAGESFVYVAEQGKPSSSGEPQQVARQRPVKLGSIQGNQYQVISGIKPGEKIIVSGILNLSDNAPITTAPPAKKQG